MCVVCFALPGRQAVKMLRFNLPKFSMPAFVLSLMHIPYEFAEGVVWSFMSVNKNIYQLCAKTEVKKTVKQSTHLYCQSPHLNPFNLVITQVEDIKLAIYLQ